LKRPSSPNSEAPPAAGRLQSTILVVEDNALVRENVRDYLSDRGCNVLACETLAEAEALVRSESPDVVIVDYLLPDGNALELLPRLRSIAPSTSVILLTGHASIDLAVRAMKEGAEHFLTKPLELAALWVVVERILDNARIRRNDRATLARGRKGVDPFFGVSASIRHLAEQARIVAGAHSPLLIQGETGVGKGVLARWVHEQSPRAREPFVDLNCAGLSKEFLESELFGHERGAFTGAVSPKQGLFETAHRGTMFLDEIGDVDPQVQPKLLKVLEEQRFRRLGETRDRSVNVRLIAATHQNLLGGSSGHRFREDLYFRISTIRLVIPPLRERADDILPLSKQFLSRFSAELGRGEMAFHKDAEAALRRYAWPGNIRELRNVIERAVLLARSATVSERDLSFESRATSPATPNFDNLTLEEIEKMAVERALELERGRVERAAARLGIARSSLYHRVRRFSIDLSRF